MIIILSLIYKTSKILKMKKISLIVSVAMLISFAGCKKDKTTPAQVDFNNLTYTDKTPSQSKSDLENTGVTMVNQMSALNKEKGTGAAVNLVTLVSNSNSMSAKSPHMATLKAVSDFSAGAGVKNVFSVMRQTSDDIGIIQIYDSIAATYTYNFNTGDFDKTASSTFSIKFPASKTAENNKQLNGLFEIARPQTQAGPFTIGGAQISELPSSIQYDIKVDGTVALNYQFTGAYNSDGMPTSISSTLTIGTFEFKTTWGYNAQDVNMNYSIKNSANSSPTILDMGWELKGNFDKTVIQNYTDGTTTDPTAILTNSNAHFQFYNIKIAGQIDFKDLYNGSNSIDKETKADTIKQRELATLVNKDVALVVVYADNNQVIAKAEAYLKPYQEEEWNFDPISGMYTAQMVTKEELDMRMIFADKSKSDLSTYFQSGFDQLTGDFNTFIDELNTTYGWTIDHVK